MREVLCAAIVLASLALPAAAQTPEVLPHPRIVTLGDRVHVMLGPVQHANARNQGYMVNSTLIVGDRRSILVDPGGSDEVGWHVAAIALGLTAKRVSHVVNTHPHGAHYLGNTAFPGARILSSEACRKAVAESGHEWIGIMEEAIGRKLPATKALTADIVYPAGVTGASINGVRLVFWVPAGSHTSGDLIVYLPDDKVLVAGDILVNGVVPTLQDGNVRNWIRTLDEMLSLDAVHFVPGHGPVMTRADVVQLRDSLARFYEGVRAAYKKGLSEEDTRRSLDLSAWEKLERSHVIGRNVNRAWLEAEAEAFAESSPPSRRTPSPPSPTSPSRP